MRILTEKRPPRPLRCALFDLDGTLVDSRADLADAVDLALATHQLPVLGQERITEFVGAGARNLIQRALQAVGGAADRTDVLLATFFDAYRSNHKVKTSLYPGVAETLKELHQRGLALALVTNKPYEFSVSLLEHFGLTDWFTLTIGGDTLPQRKPHPQPLLVALEACKATAAEAIMVGDGEHDMEAAVAANVYAVGLPHGFRTAQTLIDTGADVLLDGFPELTLLL